MKMYRLASRRHQLRENSKQLEASEVWTVGTLEILVCLCPMVRKKIDARTDGQTNRQTDNISVFFPTRKRALTKQ